MVQRAFLTLLLGLNATVASLLSVQRKIWAYLSLLPLFYIYSSGMTATAA